MCMCMCANYVLHLIEGDGSQGFLTIPWPDPIQ